MIANCTVRVRNIAGLLQCGVEQASADPENRASLRRWPLSIEMHILVPMPHAGFPLPGHGRRELEFSIFICDLSAVVP